MKKYLDTNHSDGKTTLQLENCRFAQFNGNKTIAIFRT
jgi:hypothetical protein